VNETYNLDFTTEKENRKPNSRKRKRSVPSKWRRYKNKLLRNAEHTDTEHFKKVQKLTIYQQSCTDGLHRLCDCLNDVNSGRFEM